MITPVEKYAQLPPGRKLDALVWMALNGIEPNLLNCRHIDGDVQPHAGYPAGHISPPIYSTNDTVALTIVGIMREKYTFGGNRYGFMLVGQEAGDDSVFDDLWYCEFPLPSWGEGSGNTIAHAICLAVLGAIMNG